MEFLKKVAVFTAVEVVTLVLWLGSALAGMAGRAAGILFGGLFVEHVIQGLVKAGRALTVANAVAYVRERALGLLGFTAVETVIWIVALLISQAAGAVAAGQLQLATFLFLFGTLTVKHALANNVFESNRFVVEGVLGARNLIASAVEAAGAAVWFANPSAGTVAIMAGTSFIEHVLLTRR